MRSSVVLLFLQLWGNVEVSLSQSVCSTLPDVPHAHVSEETKKAEYQEGHVIHFPCDPGYISGQTSKYVCTREGWMAARRGKCYSCSTLPDVPHARISEETKKAEYQEGDLIHFTCEPGYTSGPTIKYVCASEGWLAVRQGTCHFSASSCDPPPAVEGVTVKGLPQNEEPILPDHFLTFSCNVPGKSLNGRSVLICGEYGQWNNPFPSCEDITCKVGVMDPHLDITGLPPADETIEIGHKLQFQCNDPYELDGSAEIECLQTGEWDAPFPTCAGKCKIPRVPANIRITTSVPDGQARKGQKLSFVCNKSGHLLRGNALIECLANGEWSDPVPTCGPAVGCRSPPALANGDIRESLSSNYRHNQKVEYICQAYYTMEGNPIQTCRNGEWIGQMRCLQPCTSDKALMEERNIGFKFSYMDKIYSVHDDEIEFMCIGRTSHNGVVGMRQRCVDGVMPLPTCQ